MRISDWSSDVCSSDLWRFQHVLRHRLILNELIQRRFLDDLARRGCDIDADLERVAVGMGELPAIEVREHVLKPAQQVLARSEERRVGKEWVIPCSSR